MAVQETLSSKSAQIVKFQSPQVVSTHYSQVKVDEIAVVDWIALQRAYPVGIVTGRAWRPLVNYVCAVFRKTLVVQDAVPTVALIAERVVQGTLRGEVQGSIFSLEKKLKAGAMRTSWPVAIIVIMTVCTRYDAGY